MRRHTFIPGGDDSTYGERDTWCQHGEGRESGPCGNPPKWVGHVQPRVIRGVVRWYKDAKNAGLAKVARDRKSGYQIEAIKVKAPRWCARKGCPMRIPDGVFCARVSDGTTKQVGTNRSVPVTHDYHFGCVPKGAKYLVRFFEA